MIEKVNPSHPDKIADRIAGAIYNGWRTAWQRPFKSRCECEYLCVYESAGDGKSH